MGYYDKFLEEKWRADRRFQAAINKRLAAENGAENDADWPLPKPAAAYTPQRAEKPILQGQRKEDFPPGSVHRLLFLSS